MKGSEVYKRLLQRKKEQERKKEEETKAIIEDAFREVGLEEPGEAEQKEEQEQVESGKIYLTSKCYTCQAERRKEYIGMHYNWLQFRCPVCETITYLDRDNIKYFKDEIEGDVNILGF